MGEQRLKASLRRSAKQSRARISERDRAAWSAAIRGRLVALDRWRAAGTVALYAPIAGEADVIPLVEKARGSGKRVVFPRANTATHSLEFFEVCSASELRPGAYGVPEPPAEEAKRIPAGQIDLLVLPGLAFDLEGRRLGFGGGYYDRLLGSSPRPAIGVAFESQIHTALPGEAHDCGVDIVVTEARSIAVAGRPAGQTQGGPGKGTK